MAPPTRRPPPSPFAVTRGVSRKGFKLGIYGPEGIGKSSLAALCPGIIFIDAEYSTLHMDVARVNVGTNDYVKSWSNLRLYIQSLSAGVYALDSVTRMEDWCAEYVIKNKTNNEGKKATDSIEDYKYKAGLTFVVDEFRRFLADIDNAYMRGASFVMIAHNRVNKIKNPDGSDFIRHEPRLIDDPKASNMSQWVQFLDHLLFMNINAAVDKGKAGKFSREIFSDTSPTRLSKSRYLPKGDDNRITFDDETSTNLWDLLLAK